MGAVAQWKVCLRALDLMLADDLTAADADRRADQAVRLNQELQLPEDMPWSTLKELVQELEVPYHLATACSRATQRCPWSDATYAATNALMKFLLCFQSDGPASPTSISSLSAEVAQQLLRSGLLQHLPVLLQTAATRMEVLAGASTSSSAGPGGARVHEGAGSASASGGDRNGNGSGGSGGGSSGGGSGSSSSGSSGNSSSSCGGGDSIAPACQVIDGHIPRHILQCLEISLYVMVRSAGQQLAPHFCPLAASMLHLAVAALQYGSSQVQHFQQQQQEGQPQLTQLVCIHAAIPKVSRTFVGVVRGNFSAVDLVRLPGNAALLQSQHTLLCLAAAITLECGALAASQQGMATNWDDEGAAALHCWEHSCRTADSLGVAERWLQKALGLEAQAVQFAVLCTQPGTGLLQLQPLLALYHTVLMDQVFTQQAQLPAVMQQHAQGGQQSVQKLQWHLLAIVPAALCQLAAALAQQATADVWKSTVAAVWWSTTCIDTWAEAALQVQQPASPGLQALSGMLVQAVLPAWFVDGVLPLVLSTATRLQQGLPSAATVVAGAGEGASLVPGVVAYQACIKVCRLLCNLLRHATAVNSSPDDVVSAAAAAAGSSGSTLVSSSSRSTAVDPAACEVPADLPAPLAQAGRADMPQPWGEGVTPSGLSAHVVQVLATLQGMVRLTARLTAAAAAAAVPADHPLTAELSELCTSVLQALGLVCLPRSAESQGLALMLVVGAAGSSQAAAEAKLQGLLISLLKLQAAAALLPATLETAAAYRVPALLVASAALEADGGGHMAAVGCPEAGSEDIMHGVTAAASSAASCADPSRVLPYLVAFGRLSLQWSDWLQQQVRAGSEAHGTPAAAAASSHGSSSTPGCGLAGAELVMWLGACSAVCGDRDLLQEAGYDQISLLFRLAYAQALTMEAHGGVTPTNAGLEPVATEHLPELAQRMAEVGQVLASLATPVMCNNGTCSNVNGPSEQQLVSGRSCICAGCRTARYCSRACQKQHWKQHKAVCKALASAAAVDVVGTPTAAAAAAAAAAAMPQVS